MSKHSLFILKQMALSACSVIILLSSCTTTTKSQVRTQEEAIQAEEKKEVPVDLTKFPDGSRICTSATEYQDKKTILMTFAGDLMAHNVNWSRGNYSKIYEDIAPLVQASDLSFVNLETPVCAEIPYSTYPQFNVHAEYVQASIDAGFNVFSLANNHTNDHFLKGIKATKKYFDQKREETKNTGRPVYAAGLKETSQGPLTYQVIEKNGWKILFVAITEILNRNDYSSYIDYYYPAQSRRNTFEAEIKHLRETIECDLFVASIHCCEPEYILTVDKKQRDFYLKVLEAGADIVWANHPHVSKRWEVIPDKDNVPRKVIFYAMGNTISGQRTNPSWSNPGANRDYTGDGYMAQLRFVDDEDGIRLVWLNPLLLTTYITPERMYVIRFLNQDFIDELKENGQSNWSVYLGQRKKLMDKIQGTTLWQ